MAMCGGPLHQYSPRMWGLLYFHIYVNKTSPFARRGRRSVHPVCFFTFPFTFSFPRKTLLIVRTSHPTPTPSPSSPAFLFCYRATARLRHQRRHLVCLIATRTISAASIIHSPIPKKLCFPLRLPLHNSVACITKQLTPTANNMTRSNPSSPVQTPTPNTPSTPPPRKAPHTPPTPATPRKRRRPRSSLPQALDPQFSNPNQIPCFVCKQVKPLRKNGLCWSLACALNHGQAAASSQAPPQQTTPASQGPLSTQPRRTLRSVASGRITRTRRPTPSTTPRRSPRLQSKADSRLTRGRPDSPS